MAEEKNPEEQAPPAKRGKLLIFIIIGVVVVVLIGGLGAFFLLKNKPAADGAEDEMAAEIDHGSKKDGKETPPVYVKLETFTTNLAVEDPAGPQTAQYVQAVVELKVEDVAEGEVIKQYMPEIRNGVLRLLSSKKASQLASVEGKDALAAEIRSTVNGVVNPSPKKGAKGGAQGPVSVVLFSSFIIQ
ncbi:flagellar basal body-associated FliL family protein [Denitratisoma oestradiolicum]|uniref:Flagellar protein FliL n=1 Tax=Denitratisoma oestradiolicum TaxID=311182 RepID=A0A6S6XX05_9PROT|nr:flagellar basal body-associated FliL family protein [Denitratisoma oestradiolicum]TWO81586.1 hypothetical protein CBW56_02405 [Denitratisoma oestradiolicum]CAB1370524.1 Flagellar protein FliL [Denitratisoma oestradiolicum]